MNAISKLKIPSQMILIEQMNIDRLNKKKDNLIIESVWKKSWTMKDIPFRGLSVDITWFLV